MIDLAHSPLKDQMAADVPLTWRQLKWSDGQRSAIVICANGHLGVLDPHEHRISAEGVVTPSLICDRGCGWHEEVRLVGWVP